MLSKRVAARFARSIPVDRQSIMRFTEFLEKKLAEAVANHDGPLGAKVLGHWPYEIRAVDGQTLTTYVRLEARPMRGPDLVTEGGVGFVKETPVVVAFVNGSLDAVAVHNGAKTHIVRHQLYKLLLHEFTHVADKYTKGVGDSLTEEYLRAHPEAYYNSPSEFRAFMQEVVDETSNRFVHYEKFKKSFGQRALMVLLNLSDTWKEVSPHWTERNRQKVIKTVYQALQEWEKTKIARLHVAARFASEVLTKEWLMGVRRGWLAVMDPSINSWNDVDAAFKRLGVFINNLTEQVFYVRRGPYSGMFMTEGKRVMKLLGEIAEAIQDHRSRAKHWRDVAEGKTSPGFKQSEGEYMFELYKNDFVEATKASVERRGGGLWDQVPLTNLLDKVLKILREDAQRIKDHNKSHPTDPYEPVPPSYKEFDLYGMKVVIDDGTVLPTEIKEYLRFFDEAYQRLKQKGFAKAWYGTLFVRCQSCGGENPLGQDYGVGGDYRIGPDTVQVYQRPSSGLVHLVIHELGHRYWFKQMSQAQRGKFEALVRVKNAPKPTDPEKLKVWQEAWDDNGKPVFPVSEYGGSNIAEAWAEVFAAYVTGKDLTRDQIESFRSVMVKTARTETVDAAWVEKLRKDFLTLMKNLPRVTDYEAGAELREGFKTYRERFKKFMFDDFLNPRKDQDDASFEGVRKQAWDFYLELSMPLGYPDDYNSKAMLFDRYSREAGAWERRLRGKAQTFWKDMKDTLSYRQDGKVEVETPDLDRLVLEGFQVEIRAFKPSEHWQQDALAKCKEGLRQYRKKAARFLPWLIQRQLPLLLDFDSKLDEGGEYHGTYIKIAMSAVTGQSAEWTAHMLAHEMGHHLFKLLSGKAREFWDTAIRQDYGPLDVDELLDKWPDNLKWSSDFVEYMANKDPVLALQVDVLSLAKGGDKGYEKRDDFENAYSPTLAVPKHPITGYASKNTEESFCEAIGRLVGYGPATVLPQIKHWLEIAIPGMVKLASIRLAERSKKVKLGYRLVDTRTGEAYSKIVQKKDKPKLQEQAKKLSAEGKHVGIQTVEVHVPESWKKGDDLEPYAPKDVLEGLKSASIKDFSGDRGMTPLRKFQASIVASRFKLSASDTQLEVGKWYKHKHVGETYFLVKDKQKNGGWSGLKVVFDRAHPKAKKDSVRPGGLGSNQWSEVKESEVPAEIKEAV